jgi:uncharacterized phage-associated protein
VFLGELLVYRYRLLSVEQRDAALARQRESRRHRRLGEVLLEMGLLSEEQLSEALAHQRDQRNPWAQAV